MTKMMRSVVVSMCNSPRASAAFCFARFVRYTPTLTNAQTGSCSIDMGGTSIDSASEEYERDDFLRECGLNYRQAR
jgi:hypothetical protein